MSAEANRPTYVLITPARNEEAHIEKTIQSVISQSFRPLKWVIVSDGSTDRTDEIVKAHLGGRNWMQFVRLPDQRDRSFAAKVSCFNEGLRHVRDLAFDVIGNLDADISFEPDYFEFLMHKFQAMDKLGVAGTPFKENGYDTVTDSFEPVNSFLYDLIARYGGAFHVAISLSGPALTLLERYRPDCLDGFRRLAATGAVLTVAAGSRMRGNADFGGGDKGSARK